MPDPTQNDFDVAAQRIRDILQTRIDGDYGPTTILGDLVVDANTIVYADLRGSLGDLRQRQSLRDLRRAPPGPDTDDATDAILSNLYVSREKGQFALGRGSILFTQRVDTLLPRTARFFRTPALVFYLNSATDIFLAATDLRAVYDGLGRVRAYAADVPLIAARTGTAYNARRGDFSSWDPFSPYILGISHGADFAGGLDVETSADLIARAPTAISLRAFINNRSNDARIRSSFATATRVLTIGAGDPEMARDLLGGPFGATLHAGGHFDLYVDLPLQERTERLIVGESTPRADGLALTFRDTAPASGSFILSKARPGDVLVIASGLAGAPLQYKVAAVRALELDVVPSVPFPEATDEHPTTHFTYTVGNNFPNFDNHGGSTDTVTANTTRSVSQPGWVTLPGGAVYEVTRVEVPDAPSPLLPFVNPTTGTALYTTRRNAPWQRAPMVGEALSYQVNVLNPLLGQSARAVVQLQVGWPGVDLAGAEVLVTYVQPVGLDSIDALVTSRDERTSSANVLARASHPVYVSVSVPYRPRTLPSDFGLAVPVVVTVDEAAVVDAIVAVILSAPPGALDTGMLLSTVNLGVIYAYEVTYELHLPDGRVARYATSDRVELVPSAGGSSRLTNWADLGLPANYGPALRDLLRRYGVSDRVVRYATDSTHVTLERRS